jgi:hypothetical protein
MVFAQAGDAFAFAYATSNNTQEAALIVVTLFAPSAVARLPN